MTMPRKPSRRTNSTSDAARLKSNGFRDVANGGGAIGDLRKSKKPTILASDGDGGGGGGAAGAAIRAGQRALVVDFHGVLHGEVRHRARRRRRDRREGNLVCKFAAVEKWLVSRREIESITGVLWNN